ncbi:hypothetical protein PENANT_c030G07474 [Penicillium antarcticum]|uniref:INO80 complex subunit B-like conserved region domain-containing protein n=1 Tax=Penicillium antarcticum TaxID=416450 RepID=A0A1V6PW72_9EURO|nr:uncharacterized protein N7508_001559 [Penicillium antarcticum]KAJ5317051.1 hypothetical protein N7508_001559 [Penicillium antarcticum]OQD80962.1 hypothetical protein PENANT_c030G07474 [Penicillium antarcticum]
MPANRLREATGSGRAGRRSVNVFREDPIVLGPRSSRNRKKIVEVATSDEEEIEDQEEDEIDDEDAPGDDDDEDADADGDADGDLDMDDTPPQPPVRRSKAAPAPRVKPPKSVEAKEMEMDEDEEDEEDEEEEQISDSDDDAEGEIEDQDESGVPDVTVDDMDELDDDMLDEELEGELLDGGKMTKRQRGNLGNDFLQLPMEPQVKKHLTAEERQMRRAEMARRRKNLSEKRNEEEKMDTINRLLKKQAPKRRGRAAANDAADGTPAGQETSEPEKADPIFVRWVSGPSGCKVNVPEEWLGTPSGRMFGAPPSAPVGKMVEEL